MSFKKIKAFLVFEKLCPVEFQPMLKYFETWYIGKRAPNNLRVKPAFYSLWSVYSWVLDNFIRTNNTIEAWHKQFEVIESNYLIFKIFLQLFILFYRSIVKKHASMGRLVSKFILEQKHTDILIAQMDGCSDVYPCDKKEIWRCNTL